MQQLPTRCSNTVHTLQQHCSHSMAAHRGFGQNAAGKLPPASLKLTRWAPSRVAAHLSLPR